ncbi:hypothetical protein GCM10010919_21580 [Alishewanella longhuensis]|uniref:DUF2897 domain-containing protein n=1 Tax=Alishewanella longhuensis TaxID=1091037 RepID=A0ABQ3L1F1_9ALTE|nr:DUF2897 family protein [Alishewanella longhuensis]GHG70795.1 hypothetical protein GCM10010919_21580 [Alishewanella longhuensis]
MNWPLFWALAITFGFVIGNVMLVKRSAKQKMPSLKDFKHPADVGPLQPSAKPMATTQNLSPKTDQSSNSPE